MSGREAFLAELDVSRETIEMLDLYAERLKQWNSKINLVSPKSLPDLWTRHFFDSAQLAGFADGATSWGDLGSGGGFPGAVIAILRGASKNTVLVEADQRKAAFLRTVSRETTGFQVVNARIEETPPLDADVISARALAPLPLLLELIARHLKPEVRAILLKGKNAPHEVRDALEHWRFDCETYPSKTDPEAVILSIGDIARV